MVGVSSPVEQPDLNEPDASWDQEYWETEDSQTPVTSVLISYELFGFIV